MRDELPLPLIAGARRRVRRQLRQVRRRARVDRRQRNADRRWPRRAQLTPATRRRPGRRGRPRPRHARPRAAPALRRRRIAELARHTGAGIKPSFAYSLRPAQTSSTWRWRARPACRPVDQPSRGPPRPRGGLVAGRDRLCPRQVVAGRHAVPRRAHACSAIRSRSSSGSPRRAPRSRVGVRLRVPGIWSRFGIPLDEPSAFELLCAQVAALPAGRVFGVHGT